MQEGKNPRNSLANVVGFEGKGGLYDDLSSGRLPTLRLFRPTSATISTDGATAAPSALSIRSPMARKPD